MSLIPVVLASISIAKCSVLPMPDEPKLYFPGLAFAYAINSPTDATGVYGCTTSTLGTVPISATGAKSRCGS